MIRRPVTVALRALGLGDFVTGLPALRALRRAFPANELVLLAPDAFRPLVEAADAADRLVQLDGVSGLPPRLPAPPDDLRAPALAVNLHGRGPQSVALLEALAPDRLISFSNDGVAWRDDEHELDRWCRLLAEHAIDCDPLDLTIAVAGPAEGGYLLVHPGASSASRRWPAARWSQVARAAATRGIEVLVSAGPRERRLAERVARGAGLGLDCVVEPLDLAELARLVAGAACVASGDTGVAHLATAVGSRSVTLFGPVSPNRWGPRLDPQRHAALWAGREGDPHAESADPGLLAISARQATAAVLNQFACLSAEREELAS